MAKNSGTTRTRSQNRPQVGAADLEQRKRQLISYIRESRFEGAYNFSDGVRWEDKRGGALVKDWLIQATDEGFTISSGKKFETSRLFASPLVNNYYEEIASIEKAVYATPKQASDALFATIERLDRMRDIMGSRIEVIK